MSTLPYEGVQVIGSGDTEAGKEFRVLVKGRLRMCSIEERDINTTE